MTTFTFYILHFAFDYCLVTIFIPDDTSIQTILVKELPVNWNLFPHIPATQAYGDAFITSNAHCLLKVPSVVTEGDCNILINPLHPEFRKIRIVDAKKFLFDERVFR